MTNAEVKATITKLAFKRGDLCVVASGASASDLSRRLRVPAPFTDADGPYTVPIIVLHPGETLETADAARMNAAGWARWRKR